MRAPDARRKVIAIAAAAVLLAGLWILDAALLSIVGQPYEFVIEEPGALLLPIGYLVTAASIVTVALLAWGSRSVGVAGVYLAGGAAVLAVPALQSLDCPVDDIGASACVFNLPWAVNFSAGPSAHLLAGALVLLGIAMLLRRGLLGEPESFSADAAAPSEAVA